MKVFSILLVAGALSGTAMAQEAVTHYAGCAESDFVTLAEGDTITTQGSAYSPKCAKVVAGTTITIAANARHPLQGTPSDTTLAIANPIYDDLGAKVDDSAIKFDQTGEFGYYCVAHGTEAGTGMVGSVLVIPAP